MSDTTARSEYLVLSRGQWPLIATGYRASGRTNNARRVWHAENRAAGSRHGVVIEKTGRAGDSHRGIEEHRDRHGCNSCVEGDDGWGGLRPAYDVWILLPLKVRHQVAAHLLRGAFVPDMIAILGSMFFVVGDIDR